MTPSEICTALLAQLDAAPPPRWSVASVWVEPAEPDHRNGNAELDWLNRRTMKLSKHLDGLEDIGFITLRAGTSTFQVRDTAVHRERFCARVLTSPGFSDRGQEYPGLRPLPYTRLTAGEIAQAQQDYIDSPPRR